MMYYSDLALWAMKEFTYQWFIKCSIKYVLCINSGSFLHSSKKSSSQTEPLCSEPRQLINIAHVLLLRLTNKQTKSGTH